LTRPPTTNPLKDKVSAAALRLLDALLVRNPERTAIGVAVGLGLHGILGICQPLVASTGVDLGKLEWWASVSIGLVLVHLPFVIWSVRHRPLISDELESLIELIESTNIGEVEKRVAYRKVVNKCIDEFSLSARPGTIKNVMTKEIEGLEQRAE
jgi:hypothetical protein